MYDESYYMIFIILNYADKLLWKLSGYKIASLRNLKFSFRVKTAWWKTSTISGHAWPEMHNRKWIIGNILAAESHRKFGDRKILTCSKASERKSALGEGSSDLHDRKRMTGSGCDRKQNKCNWSSYLRRGEVAQARVCALYTLHRCLQLSLLYHFEFAY